MRAIATTLVTDEVRKKMSADPTLGAGNFLAFALKVSPAANETLLTLERIFTDGSGTVYQELSLNTLEYLSEAYARWYLAHGAKAGDLIGIYLNDGVEYFIHYLALTRIGAIAVLTNGNMNPRLAAGHMNRVKCAGVVTDNEHLTAEFRDHLDRVDLNFLVRHLDIEFDNAHARLVPYFQHDAADPIMIAHSSGTTGIPKAVTLEHGKFFYGIRSRLSVPRPAGGEKILSSLPHSHNCAMAYITLALLSGTPVFISSDHSGANLFRLIKSEQPTMVVSFPQSYVELTECDLDSDPLASVNLWFNGGDAAHESHIRRLIAKGTLSDGETKHPGSVFVDGMGSSEMGFSLFKNVHTPGTNKYRRCVGKPLEWVEAAIFDQNDEKLGPNSIGRLAVKAPSVTTGYWNNSNLTAKSRVHGYFLTGDLAYSDADGFYYHVDRTPDVIDTANGRVYSLWTEETILRNFAEISDCSVVEQIGPASDGINAAVLIRPRTNSNIDPEAILIRINFVLANEKMTAINKVLIREAKAIPLGTTGKVLKRELRDSNNQISALS